MSAPAYEIVVLAGGSSRRFGSDKLALLLDRVLAGLPGAATVTCVGPPRPTPSRTSVRWVREEPAGSGPLAGVAAALASDGVATAFVVLVGGDMPGVGAAVEPLVAALEAADAAGSDPYDAVMLVDDTGRRQLLASAWRRTALAVALAGAGDPAGGRLHSLQDRARVLELPDRWAAAHDIDTPADLPARPDAPEPTGR